MSRLRSRQAPQGAGDSTDGVRVNVGADARVTRCAGLERRLEDGYQRIEAAALGGTDIAEWEAFWLRLLREYEGICRDLDAAA